MRNGFREQIDYADNSLIVDKLRGIFYTMKTNNCEIMFICGTDEMRFFTHNDFLDYVDIHINTDQLTVFIANILYRAVNECRDQKIFGCTFLIDLSFSQNIEQGYSKSWFFKYYFIKYIRAVYKDEIQRQGFSNARVLHDNGIKIICHLGGNRFFDAVKGREYYCYDYTEFYQSYLINERIYAIGATWMGEDYSQEWIWFLNDLQNYVQNYFPIFIFNSNEYSMIEYLAPNVYMAGQRINNYPLILTIMQEFLNGQDLSNYDNWSGRCVITHKAIFQGPGGWMIDILEEGNGIEFNISGWQLFMNEEDYEYFFGYNDGWYNDGLG